MDSVMKSDYLNSFPSLTFDATYFRETRPAWIGQDDQTCWCAWRTDPSTAGPGCGFDHLVSLRLDLRDYPEAFPWELYARLQPVAGANRWAALEHFCRRGFKEGVRLPFDRDGKVFLISLARSYANQDDFLAIQAFELAAVLAPLSLDEQQHLGDSYLRLRLFQRSYQVYRELLRRGSVDNWTLRNCIKSSIFLADWDAAEEVLLETVSAFKNTGAWTLAAFELIERFFDWGLRRAQGRYAAGKLEAGDDEVAETVAAASRLLSRLGLVSKVERGSSHVLVIANCDDAVSYSQRAESKSALFAQMSIPWQLMPMTELENASDALSGAFALIFFNAPATLLPLRVLLAAKSADIPIIYEADAAVFDPAIYPPPLTSFAGLLAPQLHDEMRAGTVLRRELARRCDFGLAVTDLTSTKLEELVLTKRTTLLGKAYNPDPFVFATSTQLPRRFLFLRAPRFLALVDQPGTLGAALLKVMGAYADLGLVTSGYVHLDEGFNLHDSRLVELGPAAEPSTYRSAIAAATLTIAPTCIADDDGMTELIWLEAAELGVPALLDINVAGALGLIGGQTCIAVAEQGWGEALQQALSKPAVLEQIGLRAREHARSSRSADVVAAQLMAALRCVSNDKYVF